MRKVVIMAVAGTMVGGTVAAMKLAMDSGRPDCPGKILCPITGELICADQCPLDEAAREVSLPVKAAEELPACCASRNAGSR
jgi:hypothetical protein